MNREGPTKIVNALISVKMGLVIGRGNINHICENALLLKKNILFSWA